MTGSPSIREWLYDPAHPRRSPMIGRLLSRTLCCLGHQITTMQLDTWDDEWLACSVCGARFVPTSALTDDTEVIQV